MKEETGTLDDYLLDMLRTDPDEKRLRLRRKDGVTTHIPLEPADPRFT